MNLTKKLLKCNFDKTREKITEITIHHCAGNIGLSTLYDMFNNSSRQASSHYGVRNDDAIQMVEEFHTAWTNGHSSNKRAITIEVSNSKGAPNWEISDASFNTLVVLVYDIAKRNNLLPLVKGKNLTWHSMYSNTQCPGPYLLGKLDLLIKEVNSMYDPEKPVPSMMNLYRVRQAGNKAETQLGAYGVLDNAIRHCNELNKNPVYMVYDSSGKAIYPK